MFVVKLHSNQLFQTSERLISLFLFKTNYFCFLHKESVHNSHRIESASMRKVNNECIFKRRKVKKFADYCSYAAQ